MPLDEVARPNFDSYLGYADNADQNDCIPMELRIRVHVRAQAPGTYRFLATIPAEDDPARTVRRNTEMTISEWQPSDVETFKNRFRDDVYGAWDGKLWLRHSGPMTYEQRRQTLHNWNIRCRVRLTYVDNASDAQLCVLMLFRPTGPKEWRFRNNCVLGGATPPRSWLRDGPNPTDMFIRSNVVGVNRTRNLLASDAPIPASCTEPGHAEAIGCTDFEQNTAAHEFGHYLGLDHACAGAGGLNSSAQYCALGTIQEQRSLMAVGNDIRPAHAWPWSHRLRLHNYHAGFTWRGLTRAPPRHRG